MVSKKIITHTAELWVDDGIYYMINKKGSKETLETIKEKVVAHNNLGGGNKLPVLVDVRGMRGLSAEAREYGKSKLVKETYSAIGLIIGSKITWIMANAFMKLSKPPVPIKIFTKEGDALSWLNSLK